MELTIFQSDMGDCLLLTSAGGTRILIDGGMSTSYRRSVAPKLGELRDAGHELDVVYVSHIDGDHISGVLQLLDDEVRWRVYDYQQSLGNNVREPRREGDLLPRPPAVKAIWHNAFHEQITKNRGQISDALAATRRYLEGVDRPEVLEIAEHYGRLQTGEAQAIKVSRRISARQLNIPLNQPADHKLMMVEEGAPSFAVGDLQVRVLGPFASELERLRTRWNTWLRGHRETLKKIRRRARDTERDLGQNEFDALTGSLESIGQFVLGDRDSVTTPNLASLVLWVSEGEKTLLLTGDSHAEDILAGLGEANLFDDGDRLHVNVHKIPHHGSEHNTNLRYYQRVIADHYLFCGNGAHRNPDTRIVEACLRSRLGGDEERSFHPRCGDPFHVWFSSHRTNPWYSKKNRDHMRAVEDVVSEWQQKSDGQMTVTFLTGDAHFDTLKP